MTQRNRALVVAWLLSGTLAHAAPPQIVGITPTGITRGEASEIAINGANLAGNPRLIAPFKYQLVPSGVSDAGNWKPKLIVDSGTPVGVYPVRVLNDEGLSNPFLFSVGQLPQVLEKEDNSLFELAQSFVAPAVIEGQVAGNDVDYYRFSGRKGQRILVDAQCARIGSSVDPSIRLTTASRRYVGSADDSPGLLTDARLLTVLPEDGEYVVEFSDTRYQGGGRPVYRLVVGEVPAAEEIYPMGGRAGETTGFELRGGTITNVGRVAARLSRMNGFGVSTARVSGSMLGLTGPQSALDLESLPPLLVDEVLEIREATEPTESASAVRGFAPVVFHGRIDPAGDEDRFALVVTPGQKLQIDVEAADYGSALDGVLQVINPKGGTVLATADDTVATPNTKNNNRAAGIVSPDPSLAFTVPSGVSEVALTLKDLQGRGGIGFTYRIHVTPLGATFELATNDAQSAIPKGGTASVPVTVIRKGYTGPISLKINDAPPGLTFRQGTIADNQLLGVLTVSAAADATWEPMNLGIVGEGQGPDGPFQIPARKAIVFAQQATLPTNELTQKGIAVATIGPVGVGLEAPAAPIEVAHGFSATVAVKATLGKEPVGALALSALPLPPGLTVAPGTLKEKETEASVTVTTTTDLPLGDISIGLVAKGTVAGAGRALAVPAVTMRIVRPAAVTLTAPAVEVKAGATVEVKGKVVRKGAFKAPVTVKLNNLPAGLKADPVTVAPDQSDFALKLVAEAKAAPTTVAASIALAFQVNKKDYPTQTAPLSVKVVP